jgi:predicted phage terminase large subunit-like protein
VAIEKKSTGTTLVSVLENIQGLNIIKVDRPSTQHKINRFLDMQPFVSKKLITLPFGAKHTKMCIEHMRKITVNNTHKRDDIADTAEMAVKSALIDKILIYQINAHNQSRNNEVAKNLMGQYQRLKEIRGRIRR